MPLTQRVKPTRTWKLVLFLMLFGSQEGLAQAGADLAAGDDATVVSFVNVAVVSMQDDAVLQAQTVVIHGERIVSIGPVEAIAVPPDATVIDGSGRYLIPGLADIHVHVHAPFDDGPLYLNAGITTVLSLGTRARTWREVLQERQRSRTRAFMGPTLYTVGPKFLGGESPDEAERIVRENVEGGFDLVKVHADVSPETFDRLHETAKQLGIRVTGHAQYHRGGMQPIYTHQQDLAHVDEYLDADFNPRTPGFWAALFGGLLVLVLLSLTNVGWWMGALWRRLRKRKSSARSPGFPPVRRWVLILTGSGWLLFIGLWLTVTDPLAGVFAGKTAAISLVCILMLLVILVAVLLTMRVRSVWRDGAGTIRIRAPLLVVVALSWTLVVCNGFLIPRSWRTTEAALERIAQKTAAAGIWVTPNLVVDDYVTRHACDEFYELIQRPGMRYLRPAMRDNWVNHNVLRRLPDVMMPVQFAIWQNWNGLLSRLAGKLHEANVPLLAGSDAVGRNSPGVFPGSSLHEELSLLVQAGLSPYEALRTATVNPAVYLHAEQDFGQVAEGFRADLVLLTGNPLDDISYTRTRIGVMKRGRWFAAIELETALERLAEERK